MRSYADTTFDFDVTFVLRETLDQADTTRVLGMLDLTLREAELWAGQGRWRRVMATGSYHGRTGDLRRYMDGKRTALQQAGFPIMRSKAHTPSWHPEARIESADPMNADPYFQAVVGIADPNLDELVALARDHAAVLCHDGRFSSNRSVAHVVLRRHLTSHSMDQFHDRVGYVMKDAAKRRMTLLCALPDSTFTIADDAPRQDAFWLDTPAAIPPMETVQPDTMGGEWPRRTEHPELQKAAPSFRLVHG